jgi:UDP-N-acetylmuramate dehydrogenase
MSLHTSFKTGGTADIVLFPMDKTALTDLVSYIRQYNMPYHILGNASNVLVGDRGVRGAVIFTKEIMSVSLIGKDIISADCGASVTKLANFALRHSLSGLEFAYGIPGSVGGAIYMNAGAYGGTIEDVLQSSSCLTQQGALKILSREEHQFEYRHSCYMENGCVILGAQFKLERDDPALIKAKMDANMRARIEKQPLEYPSAGSVFKRYPNFYTAQLIDSCGLKGCREGGASVSEKHAGFIINSDAATSEDILALIRRIKGSIHEKYGIDIECEIKMIGEFN